MKKIVTAADLGGAPIYKSDLRDVFNSEIWDAVQGVLSGNDTDLQGLIISGCVITNNAGNFDMTSGVVYLNGEFMRIAAVTNQAFTKYIAASTPTNDSRTFEDGTTHAVVQTKSAGLVGSAPGSGQYITISSLTSANRQRYSTPWADIPLINGYAVAGGVFPQWRKVANRVHLRGYLNTASATGSDVCASGTLPGTNYTNTLVCSYLAAGIQNHAVVGVTSGGVLQISSTVYGTANPLYLDGLSYSIEPNH